LAEVFPALFSDDFNERFFEEFFDFVVGVDEWHVELFCQKFAELRFAAAAEADEDDIFLRVLEGFQIGPKSGVTLGDAVWIFDF